MKLKVMHLIRSLSMGGAETLIKDYALKIDREKFDIIIVTTGNRKHTFNEEILEREGIKVFYLGEEVLQGATNHLRRAFNKIQRHKLFLRIVKKEKPNIIHTHLAVNDYLLCLNVKKRKIVLYHTLHSEIDKMFSKGKERYKLTTRYCIKKKGMVPIALHSKMQKETNAFFDINNCILVPNGIDIKRFAKVNVNKKILLNTLGIVKNSFIVGHVGSFKKQKNHEFLIKVFSAVKNKQSNAHLVLIGVGVLEERIRDLVWELGLQNSVSFLGNREDIPELMSIMDVFLFPSLYEGFGNVLIEAQTVGIKCVASDNIPNDAFVTN